jgi:hypothetical protein
MSTKKPGVDQQLIRDLASILDETNLTASRRSGLFGTVCRTSAGTCYAVGVCRSFGPARRTGR